MGSRSVFLGMIIVGSGLFSSQSISEVSHSVPVPAAFLAQRTDRNSAGRERVRAIGLSNGYFDVVSLDSGQLLAVGYDGHELGRVFYGDGERGHWTAKQLPQIKGVYLTKMDFLDPKHGWAVGYRGAVLFTPDGGTSWEKRKSPTRHELTAVKFVDPLVGYVADETQRGCQVFRTRDGGRSWKMVYEDLESGHVFDLQALDTLTVLLAINDQFVERSDNGGRTWKKVKTDLTGAASIAPRHDGEVWLVGGHGSFYFSTDRGRTWQRPSNLQASIKNSNWWSIAFLNLRRGVAVGEKGAIAVTYDGGITWREIESNTNERLETIRWTGERGIIQGEHNIYEITLFPK